MPSAADITVKKADGSTDVVFHIRAPSAGDKTPAVWKDDAASILGHQPSYETKFSSNVQQTYRHANTKLSFPVVEDVGGTNVVTGMILVETHISLPVNVATTTWLEAWAQGMNLNNSTLVRSCVSSGFNAT
jgi:hypothetical protein